MSSRILASIISFLSLGGAGAAQDNACKTIDIPVSVISITGDTFRGLTADDFVARTLKKPVALKSVAFDEGSRRVLFVVDASTKLSADARRAEGEMIDAILAAARQEDTFALVPARGPGREVSFTSDRSNITQALGFAGESKEGKEQGVLDAVMTGIERFGAPQSGDAIVVIARDMEGNHKANAKIVIRALQEHHIRMFGLALGPVSTKNVVAGGSMTSTTSQGLAWTTPLVGDSVYNTGDEHFFPLTTGSGGLVLAAVNGDSRRDYSLSDPRVLQSVRQKARGIAKMITSFYRVTVEPQPPGHTEDWNLEVTEALRKHSPSMFVLYPRMLGPC